MASPRFTLVIPKLLQKLDIDQGNHHPASTLSLDALPMMLSRAKRTAFTRLDYEHTLFRLFKMSSGSEIPAGAVSAMGLDIQGEHPWWLRADPVVLQADHSNVVMLGNYGLQLKSAEISRFAAEINALLKDKGARLYTPRADEWLINVSKDPQIMTTPPLEVVGKNISEYLLKGEDYKDWQSLMNEIQMALHNSPTNSERVKNGKDMINSLWLWGAGSLPKAAPAPFNAIWTDDSVVMGLAKLNGVPFHAMPTSIFPCLNHIKPNENYLITFTMARKLASHGLVSEWKDYVTELEEVWFGPLLAYIKTGEVREIEIDTCDGRRFIINRKLIRKWWKRSRELIDFVAA